mgnify:CR=1 FL=1
MSILIANEICFSYEKSKDQILKNVSFVIEKGSYTAIVGSNGSGKSTIAKMFAENEYKSYIFIDFSNTTNDIKELFDDLTNLDLFFLKLQTYTQTQLFLMCL